MSGIKTVAIPDDTIKKLKNISKKFSVLNTGSTSDEFWIGSGGGGDGYDWSQFDIGVNKQGKLITCSQSGCSCNGPENPTADEELELKSGITFEAGYENEVSEAVEDLVKTTNTLYKVLNDELVNPQEIIGIPNSELRRAVVELVGYEKIVSEAITLDESSDGKLLKIKLQEDEDIVLVHVKDPSTDREYFLRVPPKMKTAKQARAWTFGFDEADFNPVQEQ